MKAPRWCLKILHKHKILEVYYTIICWFQHIHLLPFKFRDLSKLKGYGLVYQSLCDSLNVHSIKFFGAFHPGLNLFFSNTKKPIGSQLTHHLHFHYILSQIHGADRIAHQFSLQTQEPECFGILSSLCKWNYWYVQNQSCYESREQSIQGCGYLKARSNID